MGNERVEKRYGRVRDCAVDSHLGLTLYTIDLAGGGVKVGVSVEVVSRCSENELSRECDRLAQTKRFITTRMDAYAGYTTPNAPIATQLEGTMNGIAIARMRRAARARSLDRHTVSLPDWASTMSCNTDGAVSR